MTSSAVVFDDIPAEEPFLTRRPDHWVSPAPGIDDAAHEEQEAIEERRANDYGGVGPSIYDGRDIPRPRKSTQREISPTGSTEDKDPVEMGEEVKQIEHPEPTERNVQDSHRKAMPDQLLTMFEDCNFTYCMLAENSITVEEAMQSEDADSWRKAIEMEDRGLEEKGVLSPEECPPRMKPLKTKYVLTRKTAPDGSVVKLKARKVVQGFHQVYGRDFLETFSPVIGFDTLRIVMKMMVENGWQCRTMDFTQAYLNAPLNETIYIKNPDGSTSRLNKALYGLKQAGAEWGRTLKNHILKLDTWRQSEYDNCLFFATEKTGAKIAVIAVYVDDLLITGSWEEEIARTQEHLLKEFEGKVEKKPQSYLRLQMDRNGDDLCLHQTGYCKSIIDMVFKTPTRDVHTPLDPGADLTATRDGEEALELDTFPYRQVLGKLMYLSHMTRPDICNACGKT